MQLYSPYALVTWAAVTSLKPEQAWIPRMDCHGADGAGEDVPANEPCPMDLMCLFPSAWAHDLQIQAGPPAAKLCLLHPKDVEPLCSKSFKKPCRPHVSWWLGPHVQPPSLGSPHLWMKAPSKSLLQDLGCFQGIGVRKEEGMGHKPWVFLLAHSTLIDNPGTVLSLRHWFSQ